MSWFFCIWRNCNGLFSGFLSSASIPAQWLWRWSSVSGIRSIPLPIAVSVRRKLIFIWASICVTKFSKATTKDDTKSPGLETQKKICSCIKLDDVKIEVCVCFPIHDDVFVSVKLSSLTHIESRSKIAVMFKKLLVVSVSKTERVKIYEKYFTKLMHLAWLHSFTASRQMCLQVSRFVNNFITLWATTGFEKRIDMDNKCDCCNVIIGQFWNLCQHLSASSLIIASSTVSMSYRKILTWIRYSTVTKSFKQTSRKFIGSDPLIFSRKRLNKFEVSSTSFPFHANRKQDF